MKKSIVCLAIAIPLMLSANSKCQDAINKTQKMKTDFLKRPAPMVAGVYRVMVTASMTACSEQELEDANLNNELEKISNYLDRYKEHTERLKANKLPMTMDDKEEYNRRVKSYNEENKKWDEESRSIADNWDK